MRKGKKAKDAGLRERGQSPSAARSVPARPPGRGKSLKRDVGLLALGLALAAAAGWALKAMEHRVLDDPAVAEPGTVRVELAGRPNWMPAALAARIADSLTPDRSALCREPLTAAVYRLGEANPWVRRMIRVQRRHTAEPSIVAVVVEADFRRPFAAVLCGARYCYVDREAVRLPDEQAPRWVVTVPASAGSPDRQVCYVDDYDLPPGVAAGEIHYVVIDGVLAPPPPVGARWEGEDLADALRLVQLVRMRPYVNQITVVDVRNHGGRISRSEPQLRMYAQLGRGRRTDIRFGRFPIDSGDFVVSSERKMSYLDVYVDEHGGRLAGMSDYIDLRYDQLHVSIN